MKKYYSVSHSLLLFRSLRNRNLYIWMRATYGSRVEDALKRLTVEEKVAMLHAQSKFSSPGVPRLGIPEFWMTDGPHGSVPKFFGMNGIRPDGPMTLV